jgi:hypothetical protein
MHLGKRLFPYPTLNAEKVLSQYTKSVFEFSYDRSLSDDKFVLDNVFYELTNAYIKSLVADGKAKCLCVVECSNTRYRKTFDISETPQRIVINLRDLNDKVSIGAYIIATQDIDDFSPDDLDPDYEGFDTFSVEKYDVIAIDDGYLEKVSFDQEKDNAVSSIFIVVEDGHIKDEMMKVSYDSKKIIISLPKSAFPSYDKGKRPEKYHCIFFSLMSIPALAYALDDLKSMDKTLDELTMLYDWLPSVTKQYKNVFGKELIDEDFKTMKSLEVAQALMNYPSTKAIVESFNLISGNSEGGKDDE